MFKCCIKDLIDFKADKINISDLCRYCGISRTVFYQYLKSEKEPTVTTAIRITEYLNQKLYLTGLVSVPDLYDLEQFFRYEED